MSSDEPSSGNLVSLKDARERAIARLSDAFAHDVLDVAEFERRLTLAHRADSVAEVDRTTADLAAQEPRAASIVLATPQTGALARETPDCTVTAVFGGAERRGSWTLPRRLNAVALMGGIVLDFREATFSSGVTEIHVVAVMGGVQLVVPPNLPVEVSGTAIFGGFGHVERVPARGDPERPILRVHGVAVFGGVSVETRLPGESEQDAHRRRHSTGGRRLPAKPMH